MMTLLAAVLAAFCRPGIVFGIPTGQQNVDPVGGNGLIGLMNNVNNYAESLSSITTSGTTITLIAAAAAIGNPPSGNILQGFTVLNAGATGALTVNLPVTSQIIAALGNAIALDGSYQEPVHIMNNSGQTATLTAGDANTTMFGSAAVAVGSVRKFILRVLNSSNVTFTNVGLWTF